MYLQHTEEPAAVAVAATTNPPTQNVYWMPLKQHHAHMFPLINNCGPFSPLFLFLFIRKVNICFKKKKKYFIDENKKRIRSAQTLYTFFFSIWSRAEAKHRNPKLFISFHIRRLRLLLSISIFAVAFLNVKWIAAGSTAADIYLVSILSILVLSFVIIVTTGSQTNSVKFMTLNPLTNKRNSCVASHAIASWRVERIVANFSSLNKIFSYLSAAIVQMCLTLCWTGKRKLSNILNCCNKVLLDI